MVRQHRRRRGRAADTPPLPARGSRRSKWDNRRWAADWRCRACLARIYGVALGRVTAILRAHKTALLPRPLCLLVDRDQDDSSSVDTDGDAGTEEEAELDEEEADAGEDDGSTTIGAPPVEATRQQRLETWAHQFRRDDGYTDDPAALLALSQLLEDTGGLDHEVMAAEKLLGDSHPAHSWPWLLCRRPGPRESQGHAGVSSSRGRCRRGANRAKSSARTYLGRSGTGTRGMRRSGLPRSSATDLSHGRQLPRMPLRRRVQVQGL